MKFSGNVLNGTRKMRLDFGSDLDLCLDHLGRGFFERKFRYSQIILEWILMIVQELRSLGRGLHSPGALVQYLFFPW